MYSEKLSGNLQWPIKISKTRLYICDYYLLYTRPSLKKLISVKREITVSPMQRNSQPWRFDKQFTHKSKQTNTGKCKTQSMCMDARVWDAGDNGNIEKIDLRG